MSLNVCIVGAGTMGAGIAQICAQAGWSTVLHDAMPEGLTRGMERIESFWAKGIARGKTSQAEVDAWRPNLRTEGVFEALVERADLVIEAVPERFELKARIFGRTGSTCAEPLHPRIQYLWNLHRPHRTGDLDPRPGHWDAFLQSGTDHGVA